VRTVKTVTTQLGHSYRDENNQPRWKYVMSLGKHRTPSDALSSWPNEIEQLRLKGKHERADALEAKLERLRGLVNENEEEAST